MKEKVLLNKVIYKLIVSQDKKSAYIRRKAMKRILDRSLSFSRKTAGLF